MGSRKRALDLWAGNALTARLLRRLDHFDPLPSCQLSAFLATMLFLQPLIGAIALLRN
jgi:hypothetical protein